MVFESDANSRPVDNTVKQLLPTFSNGLQQTSKKGFAQPGTRLCLVLYWQQLLKLFCRMSRHGAVQTAGTPDLEHWLMCGTSSHTCCCCKPLPYSDLQCNELVAADCLAAGCAALIAWLEQCQSLWQQSRCLCQAACRAMTEAVQFDAIAVHTVQHYGVLLMQELQQLVLHYAF
jgi:hypothetical protein